jgi:hypothetical protein
LKISRTQRSIISFNVVEGKETFFKKVVLSFFSEVYFQILSYNCFWSLIDAYKVKTYIVT